MKKKKVIKNQKYENYWKLTVEYTDIFNNRFNNTLRIIIDFIDSHHGQEYSKQMYKKLQDKIYSIYNKADYASTRKSINQFVKLGFVKPLLKGYDPNCRKFINENDPEKKQGIFSTIFYENASFSSSVTRDNTIQNEVKFLLKTLAYHPEKKLEKKDIIALMCTPNISMISKGYLTEKELSEQYSFSRIVKFDKRKYNQISYMFTFLDLVDNIRADKNDGVSFINDNDVVVDTRRDPIRYSIYRTELKKESIRLFGQEQCYIDLKYYPGLVTSHIKDSSICLGEGNIEDAYNYENGLLLSQQNDMLFDHYNITFEDNGKIIVNETVLKDNVDELNRLKNITLDARILTDERRRFLVWHRQKCLDKINSANNVIKDNEIEYEFSNKNVSAVADNNIQTIYIADPSQTKPINNSTIKKKKKNK